MAARKACLPSMEPVGQRLVGVLGHPGDQAVDTAVERGPDPAADHAVAGAVVHGVDGGVAVAHAGPDPVRVAEQMEELLVPPLLHGPQRARGDDALGLVLLQRGGVLGRGHREDGAGRLRGEVELAVLPRLELAALVLSGSLSVGHSYVLSRWAPTRHGCSAGGSGIVFDVPLWQIRTSRVRRTAGGSGQVPAAVGNHPETRSSRARSHCRRARRAATGSTAVNDTVSPGPSWPSTGRSAVITQHATG